MKYIDLLYTAALVIFMGILSFGLGIALFGPVICHPATRCHHPRGTRRPLAHGYGVRIGDVGNVDRGIARVPLSSLVENGIGPIIERWPDHRLYIIGNVPVDLFASIKPYLFTTYLDLWTKVIEDPVPWDALLHSVLVLGAFSVGFYLVTWYIFARKDVLS
jgi:ABC-2 type transport system permease protein